MGAEENILKQDIIAKHLKILYEEVRALKRDQLLKDRENETGAGELPQDGNYAMEQRFSFEACLVTSLLGANTFLGLRTIPTSLDSPGWTTDPEFSAKPLVITKPPNVDLPAVGDIIPAFFTGTYGEPPTARYGVFGVGGGTLQLVVKTVFGDYLRCRTFVDSVEGATDIDVAKAFKLRQTPFDGATVDGITYSGFGSGGTQRTATVGGFSRSQRVAPKWLTNDIIYAIKVPKSQVFVSSVQLTLLDINADGRAWVTL